MFPCTGKPTFEIYRFAQIAKVLVGQHPKPFELCKAQAERFVKTLIFARKGKESSKNFFEREDFGTFVLLQYS